jgi:hypothetical protein
VGQVVVSVFHEEIRSDVPKSAGIILHEVCGHLADHVWSVDILSDDQAHCDYLACHDAGAWPCINITRIAPALVGTADSVWLGCGWPLYGCVDQHTVALCLVRWWPSSQDAWQPDFGGIWRTEHDAWQQALAHLKTNLRVSVKSVRGIAFKQQFYMQRAHHASSLIVFEFALQVLTVVNHPQQVFCLGNYPTS